MGSFQKAFFVQNIPGLFRIKKEPFGSFQFWCYSELGIIFFRLFFYLFFQFLLFSAFLQEVF